MKYLIFGANGQVGYELARLCQHDHQCIALTKQQVNFALPGEVETQINHHRPDVVINAAAYTAVDKAETEPSLAMMINAVAVQEMARACNKHGIMCIHYSTDYVFDGSSRTPYRECDQVSPLGIYGKTKLAGERFLQQETDSYLILRTSWVYSWRGANFVKTMLRLAKERDRIHVVNDQLGSPTYACDIAQITLDILKRLEDRQAGDIFHISGRDSTTWYEFARAIFKASGDTVEVNPIPTSQYPTPARRPQFSILNNAKLYEMFGLVVPGYTRSLKSCVSRIALDEQ